MDMVKHEEKKKKQKEREREQKEKVSFFSSSAQTYSYREIISYLKTLEQDAFQNSRE